MEGRYIFLVCLLVFFSILYENYVEMLVMYEYTYMYNIILIDCCLYMEDMWVVLLFFWT